MDYEQLVTQLEATGDDRVLRRFALAELYAPLDGVDPQQLRVAMVVDTETTGLDPETDRIIDLGYLLVEFHPKTGRVHRVLERYSGFEDPGVPIPAAITALTGIADADVAGKTFDEARIEAAIARAHLVIAHNAPFDRGFLERRFPSFMNSWWACSQREAPWQAMMTGSTKLEWLACQLGGVFYAAHRALVDAEVRLFLLTRPDPEDRTILSHLLERSGRTTYCVWAEGAPFERKEPLKRDKGYAWSDRHPARLAHQGLVSDVGHGSRAELAMPGREIHPRPARVTVDAITGRERYTDRCRSREQLPLGTRSCMAATVMIFDWLRPAILVWLTCAIWFVGLETVLLGTNARAEMAADRHSPPWLLPRADSAQDPRERASQGRAGNPLPKCGTRFVTAADRFRLASDNQAASAQCPSRPNR